jgi:DNA-binding transcriptional regulator YiaG
MHLTQQQFAAVLGVRQQTVSEWEVGAYEPTRATCHHLTLVAERAGFQYQPHSE